ncbi:MAG: hypothetical protein ACRD3B_09830 [Candidatus Sulfotelmatobacter sp.]
MNRMYWLLADTLSWLLEPDERDAVFGDFAESGETGGQALCGVLGLVVRRQAALWSEPRPWLVLLGVIVPLGMLLSIVSRSISTMSAIYLWMYANNWGWELTKNPGFWRVMAETTESVSLSWIVLSCCSWTCGFVLGCVSRGMDRINRVLFCFMLLFGVLIGAPQYFFYVEEYLHRVLGVPHLTDSNAVVFAIAFYRDMLPLIVQAILVAIPALWGLRQGLDTAKLGPVLRAILWTAAITTLAGVAISEPGFWIFLGPYVSKIYANAWLRNSLLYAHFVAYWPLVYLAALAVRRHRHITAPI